MPAIVLLPVFVRRSARHLVRHRLVVPQRGQDAAIVRDAPTRTRFQSPAPLRPVTGKDTRMGTRGASHQGSFHIRSRALLGRPVAPG
jgi:hypothetical protein